MWVDVLKSFNHITILKSISVPAPALPVSITAVWLHSMQHALNFVLGECAEEARAFSFSTLYRSNGNGCDDYMCKCTKSSTLQRDIIPKLQKSLKHAFNYFSLKGCWVRPLKKVAVFKISDCWWGFLGTVLPSTSLLHLPDHLRRHRGVEVDCVVSQALSGLVTLPTPAFEWFADADLRSVAILSVVLYAVYILWRRQKFPMRSHTCRTLAWTGSQ